MIPYSEIRKRRGLHTTDFCYIASTKKFSMGKIQRMLAATRFAVYSYK